MTLAELSEREFNAWLAGFFDGEGNISWVKRATIRLTIANTVESVIVELQTRLGYGSIRHAAGARAHWSEQWVWRCGARLDVQDFLERVRPYLRIKGAQADAALALIAAARAADAALLHRNQEIVGRLNAGWSGRQIAAHYGLSHQRSSQIWSAWKRSLGEQLVLAEVLR